MVETLKGLFHNERGDNFAINIDEVGKMETAILKTLCVPC